MSGLKPGERVPIIVALISLTGVLFGTLVANWDKVFSRSDHVSVVATPRPTADAAPVPPPTDEAAALAASQKRVLVDSADALNSIAEQIEGQSRPSIGGAWHDGAGNDFVFTQNADAYRFVQSQNGVSVGSGDGRLSGRSFEHAFRGRFGSGQCTGSVSVDGQVASGTCRSGADSWEFAVRRQGRLP